MSGQGIIPEQPVTGLPVHPTASGGRKTILDASRFVAGACMSEDDLLRNVIDVAEVYGWLVMHIRPARILVKGVETYRTPYQGDKGFPDLVLARAGHVLHVELKSEAGTLSEEQVRWGVALGATFTVWRPKDWLDGAIEKELR